MSAIAVRDLSKSYGPTRALDGVSLEVGAGESRALLGRNGAGKSTLVAILTGLETADSGTVDAGGAGVACVYQRSTLVPDLTGAENIALGAYPRTRIGTVDWRRIRSDAVALLDEWGCSHLADRPVADMEPLERKITEICRATARRPAILLLDEPTAGLDAGATAHLFDQIAQARQRGVTLIYVSHHLQEVFEVCDTVTILRDGRNVLTGSLQGLAVPDLVEVMVGDADQGFARARQQAKAEARAAPGGAPAPVLAARGVTVGATVRDVTLEVQPGECLGVTGLDGAGHVELAQVLAGVTLADAGAVTVGTARLPGGDVAGAIRAGIGYVPQDRHASGFVPGLSVEENSTLSVVDRLRNRLGLVDAPRRRHIYSELADRWSIRAARPDQPTEELSGGNQQKVVLARALASDPRVLVLVNPTAGVDVAAKDSIYASISEATDAGRAAIVCSSDDADLEICHRVLVLFSGRIVRELVPPWEEQDLVVALQGADAG